MELPKTPDEFLKLAMTEERFNNLTEDEINNFRFEDYLSFLAYMVTSGFMTMNQLYEWIKKERDKMYVRKKMFNGIPKDF